MICKYNVIGEHFEQNFGTTEYFIEVELDINSLDNFNNIKGNIFKMIQCDPYWIKIIAKYNKSPNINISANIIKIKSKGMSKCSPDDGFDKDVGKNIAKRRALIKLYNNLGGILNEISDILSRRFVSVYSFAINCKKKSVDLNNSTRKYIDGQNKNYWDDKD